MYADTAASRSCRRGGRSYDKGFKAVQLLEDDLLWWWWWGWWCLPENKNNKFYIAFLKTATLIIYDYRSQEINVIEEEDILGSLPSGGWQCGAAMLHLLKISERTVAHCTFFTNNGIIEDNSVLPKEWDKAHAQWISLIAGCVSCKEIKIPSISVLT